MERAKVTQIALADVAKSVKIKVQSMAGELIRLLREEDFIYTVNFKRGKFDVYFLRRRGGLIFTIAIPAGIERPNQAPAERSVVENGRLTMEAMRAAIERILEQ